jgi:hypothetical protein
MEITFKKRMNLLVGDNGLGKSFLLDAAWWALTRTWASHRLTPKRQTIRWRNGKRVRTKKPDPQIAYRYTKKTGGGTHRHTSKFNREAQIWPLPPGRPSMPGLVLYAQVDGGFSCWDPARNYWRGENPNRESAYRFKPDEIWDGLPLDEPDKLCNGLITDWGYWQLENGEPFKQLMRVLKALSPSEDEPLQPGALISKVSMEDSRKHPSIRMSYGQQVPLIHASAGIRRVVALAYLLVWVWQEHVDACALQGVEPAREIIFLIDEIEAHLHPQWQRRIVPALLEVMEALTGDHQVPVQLIAATHSPLIMASAEPEFDEASDGVYHLDLTDGAVTLKDVAWSKQGDVVNWLVSEVFGLRQGRSVEAERAIEAAEAWMRGDKDELPEGLRSKRAIQAELERVLAGHDPFWPRWIVSANRRVESR